MRNCQEHLFPVIYQGQYVQAYLADEGYTMNNRRTAKPKKNQMEIIEKIKKTQRLANYYNYTFLIISEIKAPP